MRYQRTFRLQASHFNDQWSYEQVWNLPPANRGAVVDLRITELVRLLSSVHGHNFKIVVTLDGVLAEQDWLIDDRELALVVMGWDNTNLSMHPDFFDNKLRATTENMARVLLEKLTGPFGELVKNVTVYETDDIFASI